MKLIDKAIQQHPILAEPRIRKAWCPKTVGYEDVVQCVEGKYDCHNRSCWDIDVDDSTNTSTIISDKEEIK